MSRLNTYAVCFLACLMLVNVVHSQEIKTSKDAVAIKYFKKSYKSMKNKEFYTSLEYAEKAIKKDPNFVEAYVLAAEMASVIGNYDKSCNYYTTAINIDTAKFYKNYLYAAYNYMQCGKPDSAVKYFEQYFLRHPNPNSISAKIRNDNELCKWRIEQMEHPLDIALMNMGPAINSEWEEYLPAITADESMLIFTVQRPRDKETKCPKCLSEEDFYYSEQVDGVWKEREFLTNINSHYNEGGQCISPDGKYMIFTACDRDEGFGSCDLYWSKRVGNKWSKPQNCGQPVNTKYWESQPTFAADGKTIYYISNRPGGVGKKDIWQTTMVEEGVFTEPKNVGKPINTIDDEVSAYIHPDGKTMYFVSYGHKGMGDADIFYTTLGEDGVFAEPVNMGYPINTHAEEFSLVVNAHGDKAYFSSDKEGGFGNLDLYWFELPEAFRPSPVTYFKGKIYDAQDNRPLQVLFEVVDVKTGSVVVSSTSDPVSGEFLVCIPTNNQYALNATKENYLFYSENFHIDTSFSQWKPYEKDIALKRMEIGESVVLRNVFFDTDEWWLKKESEPELQRLVKLMKENPRMRIEIAGHTDNVGTYEYNQKLSNGRAKAIYDYLVKAGIDASRMTYKGYAYDKPVADNATEEGRALNRRTEFTIIGF